MYGRKTVEDRINEFGQEARSRYRNLFQQNVVSYPPDSLTFIAIKNKSMLEVWAKSEKGWTHIFNKEILKQSGTIGPKLREDDKQVPEGIYEIESMNPNSRFHVSLRVSYPNDFDKKIASIEQRDNLGGDIMIHGNNVSIGCLAMGDEAAEELFTLVFDTGRSKVKVIICPLDLRVNNIPRSADNEWVNKLYIEIDKEMSFYKN